MRTAIKIGQEYVTGTTTWAWTLTADLQKARVYSNVGSAKLSANRLLRGSELRYDLVSIELKEIKS